MKITTTSASIAAANDNDPHMFHWDDETESLMKALYDQIAAEPVPQFLIDLVENFGMTKEAV